MNSLVGWMYVKGRSGRYRLAVEEKGSEEDDNCDFIIKKTYKGGREAAQYWMTWPGHTRH